MWLQGTQMRQSSWNQISDRQPSLGGGATETSAKLVVKIQELRKVLLPKISDFLRFFAPFFGLSEEVFVSLDLMILEGT